MNKPGPNPADDFAGSTEEQRLGELINEFFDRRESGENITEEAFLAAHPEYAEQLREHLCGLDLLEKMGSSSARRTLSNAPSPTPSDSSAEAGRLGSDPSPPQIPGYEILKQIGRGGMGVVFKAVQQSTKRLVALKLLLEGPYASETSRRRFEREITLAAQLRHPNIIPIYDSGVSDGRMYYAMEHVHGLPLSDYFRAHSIDIEGKLKLFVRICNAVSHAHIRGVVHRDLKPSNILVDSEGEPHVLDFGLAKAGFLADMTTSVSAQIVGTPAYMSPEQASGDPSGVDIRTDVYAMGVMLFEVLTSEMPYDTTGAMGKTLANISEAEPPCPSKVNPKVDAELAAVVLKALRKSKDDRYQSVDALGNDLQHYLAGEPVSAKPPSGFYLLRKALYKYRLPVGIAAVLVICVSAMLLMFRFMRTSKAEVELARHETRLLQEQVTAKEAARAEAEKGRQRAETSRQEYEWLVKNVDPELAGKLDPFARALGQSLGSGEDPTVAFTRFAAQLFSDAEGDPNARTLKKQDLLPDPSVPLSSPRPTWVQQDKSKVQTAGGDDMKKKVLNAVVRRLGGQAPTPASQPAAMDPPDSAATAQTPPTTQPPGPEGG
jgi:hypothetical protein